MVPPNSAFSAFAFIGFILVSIPLPWHLQSWNTGSCMYMVWTSLGCLIFFINSIVWNDNVINWAPVWCDIVARFIVGASIGIPASALCIIRRLYYITKLQSLTQDKKTKRRETMVDVSIGVGFPCLVMALQYIVQGHRFNIYEQIGCYPDTYNTLPAYFVVFMWPLIIGMVSMVYAALTFHRALAQKTRLQKMLQTSCNLSAGRYWRLMALCATEIACTVPLSIFAIVMNILNEPPQPYGSWALEHWGFSRVDQFPTIVWQSSTFGVASLEMTRWSYVLCAFVFFSFFGWAQEARDYYHHTFRSVARRLGFSVTSATSGESLHRARLGRRFTFAGKATLPIFAENQTKSKHLSMPVQARVKHRSLPLNLLDLSFGKLPAFASRSDLSSGSQEQVSVDILGSQASLPSFHGRHDGTRVHVAWSDILAEPQRALTSNLGTTTPTRSIHIV